MRIFIRLLVTISLLFAPFPLVAAQKAVAIDGRWEGAVTAGDQSVPVAFDLTTVKEGIGGTFSGGPENIADLPLTSVTRKDRTLRIVVPGGAPGDAVFEGVIAEDGVTLKGTVLFGGETYPFSVKRTAPPRAPIS